MPPEGIFDVFECTELTYRVNPEKELKTTLTLSPPPSGGAGGGSGGFGLSANQSAHGQRHGAARLGSALSTGQYPAPWTGPQLSELPLMTLGRSGGAAAEG